MSQFLFKKIRTWVIAPVFVVILCVAVFFGANIDYATTNEHSVRPWQKVLVDIAYSPSNINRLFTDFNDMLEPYLVGYHVVARAEEQRFENRTGFWFDYLAGTRPDAGYMLLSRYDGDRGASVVELYDLNQQTKLYSWPVNIKEFKEQGGFVDGFGYFEKSHNIGMLRFYHPLLAPDGALYVQNGGALVKFDVCGNFARKVEGFFHHAQEFDAQGNIWSVTNLYPSQNPHVAPKFKENGIRQTSPEGEVLFDKSIVDILVENGHKALVYGVGEYQNDPLHTNDVQPVLEDGPFYNKDDVFISMRHTSTVFLYRPSTNEILWLKTGPWMHQHDVDVLDKSRISIFDNNRIFGYRYGRINDFVQGFNDVVIYDFETDEITSPYKEALAKNDVRTVSEGLSEILDNGDLFVEEQNYGRILQLNKEGDVVWEYVNRAQDDYVYITNWSRYYPADKAPVINAILEKAASCPAENNKRR